MGDDQARLARLWQEKRGEAEPEDLSGNLIVQRGVATEVLNRQWYEGSTGRRITDVQRRVRHPTVGWLAGTLDGRIEGSGAVFEAPLPQGSFSAGASPSCSVFAKAAYAAPEKQPQSKAINKATLTILEATIARSIALAMKPRGGERLVLIRPQQHDGFGLRRIRCRRQKPRRKGRKR